VSQTRGARLASISQAAVPESWEQTLGDVGAGCSRFEMRKNGSWLFNSWVGGRRTESRFGGSEPSYEEHGPAPTRTAPQRRWSVGCGGRRNGRERLIGLRGEQFEAERQQGGAAPVSEETEVANAYQAFGRTWRRKRRRNPQREGAQPFLVVERVALAEGDLTLFESNQSVVGDRDSMRVTAQIAESMFGSSKGRFGINYSIGARAGVPFEGRHQSTSAAEPATPPSPQTPRRTSACGPAWWSRVSTRSGRRLGLPGGRSHETVSRSS
jgi:hypothetical protein